MWTVNCLTLLFLLHTTNGIQWLALSKFSAVGAGGSSSPMESVPPEKMCNSMRGSLIKKQIKFCKRNPSFMDSVRLGAARAIDECQYQFQNRRWNCSTYLQDNINEHMTLITDSLKNLGRGNGNGGKQKLDFGPHGPSGFGSNNGLNPFSNPYDNMYGSSSRSRNTYRSSNERSSRQVNQAFNRNRNVRRGRRLSRRAVSDFDDEGIVTTARHGLNGNQSKRAQAGDEVTNDTRMPVNPIQQTAPSMASTLALPSIQPQNWAMNAMNSTGGIPLDFLNTNNAALEDEDDEEIDTLSKNRKNRQNRKNKGRKNNKKSGKKNKKLKYGTLPVVVSPGTRESAFVHAISSAGVAHALTRACSSGDLENCGCDRSLRGISPEGFQWSGCSDNVDFGITFSRNFVDARDGRKSRKNPRKAQPLMNLHNNEVGRKLLERNMKVECKCHGVSGSCELKTCWRSVASFRMIGEILKKKFDGAQEVRQRKRRGRRMLEPRFQRFKPHTDTDLVFLKESPSYCEMDVQQGSLGTRGRECDPKGNGPESCHQMCCDRGFETKRERRVERCKCKFHWCCFVQCEECYRDVEVSTCK